MKIATCYLLFFGCPTLVLAQVPSPNDSRIVLCGNVHDTAGKPLAFASITLLNVVVVKK